MNITKGQKEMHFYCSLLLFRSKKVYKIGKSLTNESSNINHLVCGLKTRKLKDNKEKFIQ